MHPKYELSIRVDGRASIEHQLLIHVNDLVDCSDHSQQEQLSLMEVLQGIKYVLEYRIRGNKQPSLDRDMMKRLADGLLLTMKLKPQGLLKTHMRPEADLAFELFIEMLQEVQEFRDSVSAVPSPDLRHALKIHRRMPEQKEKVAEMLVTLTTLLPNQFQVTELVKPEAWRQVEAAVEQYGPAVEVRLQSTKKQQQTQKGTPGLFPPPALYSDRRIKRVIDMYSTNPQTGLSSDRVALLQEHYGHNVLPTAKQVTALKMFWTQLTDFMVVILIISAAVSMGFGEFKSAIVLLIVVVMNVVIGFVQELKASRALNSLMSLSVPQATVIRDSKTNTINSQECVPGDIVVLEEGDAVPADLRLVEVSHLEVEESILTGESLPVTKSTDEIRTRTRKLPLGDCKGNAFMGTTVARGRGLGVVVRTGEDTEVGKIASHIVNTKEVDTPMQVRLRRLGIILVFVSAFLCGLVVIIGLARQLNALEVVKLGIALAVSVIPEGLVAVTTITMAIGVRRMAAQKAIIRKLAGVESLGGVSVICSDKTGTLTEGKMTASEVWVSGADNAGTGYGFTQGADILDGSPYLKTSQDTIVDPKRVEVESTQLLPKSIAYVDTAFVNAMAVCSMCNNSSLAKDPETHGWKYIGDFTEIAMLVASIKSGFDKPFWEKSMTKVTENAFDSDRKLMSVVYKAKDQLPVVYAKGAPESLLRRSKSRLLGGRNYVAGQLETEPLTEEFIQSVSKQSMQMASAGLRVLGVAIRQLKTQEEADKVINAEKSEVAEVDLSFIGLIGLIDPPRKGVKESIDECRKAGIKVVMITGDHIVTAQAIATNLGILNPEDPEQNRAIKGEELDLLSEEAFKHLSPFPNVFARVSPDNKLRIVQALQNQGQAVAMTGDGVNDSPAIKAANVGVAMGISGTEITKQAADVILADDNFSTIVLAVKEGRRVFDNIQKFVVYLLSCNFAEIITILLALIIGVEPPFTTMMILFANIIADVPPSMSIGVEPAEFDVMERPPRDPSRGVLTLTTASIILAQSMSMGLISLGAYLYTLQQDNHLYQDQFVEDRHAQTLAFFVLTTIQLVQSFYSRSVENSVFKTGITENKWMVAAFLLSYVLMIMSLFIPGLNTLLDLQPLVWLSDWIIVIIAVVIHLVLSELLKVVVRLLRSRKQTGMKRVFSKPNLKEVIITN